MKKLFVVVILLVSIAFISCKKNNVEDTKQSSGLTGKDTIKYKIEFVELGSVNCIPCK